MGDLTERLRTLDRLPVPDLWPEVLSREPERRPAGERMRRVAVASLALAVAAGGIALAARALLQRDTVTIVPITPKANGMIAFTCGDTWPFNSDLCVVDPDGTGRRTLITGLGQLSNPAWSPDGSRIVFQVGGGIDSGGASIFVARADGTGMHELTPGAYRTYSRSPDWSPDGARIAFSREPDGSGNGADIFVMGADGTHLTRLVDSPGYAAVPKWSPDGTRLAYVASESLDGPTCCVHVLYLRDGSDRVVTRHAAGSGPAWSPDATRIAFGRGQDVLEVHPDGTGERVLATCDACSSVFDVTWSPDGGSILFSGFVPAAGKGYAENLPQLFVVDQDGTNLRQLTTEPGAACCAAWQSVPARPPSRAAASPSAEPSASSPPTSGPPPRGVLTPTPSAASASMAKVVPS